MPKKARNARHTRAQNSSRNTSGRSSPAPVLLDVAARTGTPDIAQSVLESATPEFSIHLDRDWDNGNSGGPSGTQVQGLGLRAMTLDDSLYEAEGVAAEGLGHKASMMNTPLEYARPSPLELSPIPQVMHAGDLSDIGSSNDVDESQETVTEVGHVRAPIIPTEHTMLDSISRTARGVASALPTLPRGLPTPPRVSRPVSFGSFFAGQGSAANNQEAVEGPPLVNSAATNIPTTSSAARAVPGTAAFKSSSSRPTDRQMGYGSPLSPHGGGQRPQGSRPPVTGMGMGRRRSSAASNTSLSPDVRRPSHRTADEVSELDLELNSPTVESPPSTDYGVHAQAGRSDEEEVVFSAWDTLVLAGETALGTAATLTPSNLKRVLLLGYNAGLQIWDCTELGSVKEIVNLSEGWGKVSCIRVLPSPLQSKRPEHQAELNAHRPLLGIIASHETDAGRSLSTTPSSVVIYSLASHRIVSKIDLIGPGFGTPFNLVATAKFIVISTSSPLGFHIHDSATFEKLHSISHSAIMPFIPDILVPSSASRLTSALSTHLEQSLNLGQTPPSPVKAHTPPPLPTPRAVFATHGRLIAYASYPPRQDGDMAIEGVRPRMRTQSNGGSSQGANGQPLFSVGGMSVTQADIGNAAVKVGGGMLSGMKMLGGLAYGAAKSRLAGPATPTTATAPSSRSSGAFASKSAPADYSSSSTIIDMTATTALDQVGHMVPAAPLSGSASRFTTGYFVRVLDLAPLAYAGLPELVAEFVGATSSPIAQLAFTHDGGSIVVAPKDGQVVKVFKLQPLATPLRTTPSTTDLTTPTRPGSASLEPPQHVYDLRRGRSAGTIETIEVDPSGRWVGIGTRNGTVHLFATNPYGGRPDERSHIDGRVRNVNESISSSTSLVPIARFRSPRPMPIDGRTPTPMAFTMLSHVHSSHLPSTLRPALMPYLSPSTPAISLPPSPAQRPVSASPSSNGLRTGQRAQPATNIQDLVIFDPVDGLLSLRRATLDCKRYEGSTMAALSMLSNISLSASPSRVGTSMSLPSSAPLSRLGSSPTSMGTTGSSPHTGSGSASGLAHVAENTTELVAKESTIATWNVKRGRKWKTIRTAIPRTNVMREHARPPKIDRPQWIAQAELSTFSREPQLLSRSVYLAHQFNFYGLGGDYHALIRGFQFDVSGPKLDVRKEVEVNAYPNTGAGIGEHLNGTSPRDISMGHGRSASSMGVPSSFDESLSSALSGGLDPTNTTSPRRQLPMYPNGMPGSQRGGSYRATAPIRAVAAGLGEGVSGGFGRLRRGMGQVRSPQIVPVPEAGHTNSGVPLEFDEEDLVLDDDHPSKVQSRSGGDVGAASSARAMPAPVSNSHRALIPAEEVDEFDELVGGAGVGSNADEGPGAWSGWDAQDRQAIDDAEHFHELVVGDMDEDHLAPPPASVSAPASSNEVKTPTSGTKTKKKGRKAN